MQKKHSDISKLFFLLLVSILLISLSSCTISKEYGPYKGKVVDAESNESIEGAVVLLRIYTIAEASPGGIVPKVADAIEVLTDKRGEFNISIHNVRAFRIFHSWEPHVEVTIFKPGYGVFPKHPASKTDNPNDRYKFEENIYVTVQLPKLLTKEERRFNIGTLRIPYSDIPFEKQVEFISLVNIESKEIGLEPIGPK